MLIGLDGFPLVFPKTGVGHYTAQLAQALALLAPEHEFRLVYPSVPQAENFHYNESAPSNLTTECVPVKTRRLWWAVGVPLYVRKKRVQLFHGTNYDIPLWRNCKTVLTIHDLSQFLHPETHEEKSVKRAKRRLPLMSKIADAIIVPTSPIRAEVCEYLDVSDQKVFVIPEAPRKFFQPINFAATHYTREKFGIGDRFVLAVGTLEPRKNLQTLVTAFEKLDLDPSLQLVIAGGKGWLSSPIIDAIEQSPVRSRVVLTDYLGDDDLRALYSSCRLFVYPSLYEGFGLPPVEAMACGAPVVVSNIPVLVESTGGVARVADPHDAKDLARVMLDVLMKDDERARLANAGVKRAGELTWEDAAKKTLEVYETVLAQ